MTFSKELHYVLEHSIWKTTIKISPTSQFKKYQSVIRKVKIKISLSAGIQCPSGQCRKCQINKWEDILIYCFSRGWWYFTQSMDLSYNFAIVNRSNRRCRWNDSSKDRETSLKFIFLSRAHFKRIPPNTRESLRTSLFCKHKVKNEKLKEIPHLVLYIRKLCKNFLGNNFTKSFPPRFKRISQTFQTVKS